MKNEEKKKKKIEEIKELALEFETYVNNFRPLGAKLYKTIGKNPIDTPEFGLPEFFMIALMNLMCAIFNGLTTSTDRFFTKHKGGPPTWTTEELSNYLFNTKILGWKIKDLLETWPDTSKTELTAELKSRFEEEKKLVEKAANPEEA